MFCELRIFVSLAKRILKNLHTIFRRARRQNKRGPGHSKGALHSDDFAVESAFCKRFDLRQAREIRMFFTLRVSVTAWKLTTPPFNQSLFLCTMVSAPLERRSISPRSSAGSSSTPE